MTETKQENIIAKSIDYQRLLKNFKDNLPLGLAIASILGGINQFYSLLSIGPYYVRFFSVSQLLSDGLWISYLLLPFYFVLIFTLPFIIATDDDYLSIFYPTNSKGGFDKTKVKAVNLLIIIFVYAPFFYYILTETWKYGSIFTMMTSFVALLANMKLGKKFDKENVFDIFAVISMLIFISSIYFTWKWTFRDNQIPKNLINKSVIEKSIEKNHPSYEYKILYMNDKYIFSKIYCDSINDPNARIFILPSEVFSELELKP
ncbi:MAG TPA: hypothetical protein PLL09_14560 [Flavobacterium sp.]|mgnify:CR=1 FL=1|uniref:hypothetical protein n=1 Tax=unclassified Flavobacterium TaxID=196869 RepID=UPI0025C0E914|nr:MULTISPECIES: hypothetical protein [unclassified Flavobacterium]HRE79038.1 hypothetical protein [Flavobacterium sp.]